MPRWAGCVSGALERSDYQARLAAAGFTDVAVTVEPVAEGEAARPWRSALITAYKPGAAGYRPDTSRRAAPRERSAVPGRQTGVACCGPDCCQH